jgi:carboxyl-terminal processing protease
MKKLALVGAGSVAGFLMACALAQALSPSAKAEGSSVYGQLNRFGEAYGLARADYVEAPDDRGLVEGAISGMLSSLDPHSSYFDPEVFAEMQVKTDGQYGGVGLVIGSDDGIITIINPIDGTPADKAGLKSGDTIVAIDGQSVSDMQVDDVENKLRGDPGTKVTLSVLRKGQTKPGDVVLTRALVSVEAVTWKRKEDVGYIRIPAFNDQTNDGVKKAVSELNKEVGPGIKGYIIDLRDNGGGVLDAAIAVSDDFLESGEIVSTRGRDASDVERYNAHPGDIANGKPIIVLINGGTASASEIVAGALKDHKRATIVGMTSFGKGSVQTIIPMDGGQAGALHLTTARYYTPSGQSIQATGIIPDVAVEEGDNRPDEQATAFQRESDLPHHLDAEGIVPPSIAKAAINSPPDGRVFDDYQLTYALNLLEPTLASTISPRPRPPHV